ncbi:HIRAN domain-containing protein [Methanobrevibacter sp.]|uniref:HIRAN domain-containing protein n=1 Tax=Methanobrevibacter sp. TaxID=66852 RepID=UPI0038668287
MCILKAKVVGMNFHKVETPVETGDYVILAAEDNEHDPDAVAVYNGDKEIIGYIANSDKTLSPNNRKNGNLDATELQKQIDFSNKEFYGEVDKAFSSCLFIKIDDGKWSYINKPGDDVPLEFVTANELAEIGTVESVTDISELKAEVESLKAIVADLHEIVLDLKLIAISRGK